MKKHTEDNLRKIITPILAFILLIVPGVFLILIRATEVIGEWFGFVYFFVFRRPGNSAKRSSCCDNRPADYGEGVFPEQIPELKDRLIRAGFAGNRNRLHYYCSTCKQHWILFLRDHGMGDVIVRLKKAI
ncbi:MAG TPA: hypothetical protein VFL15_01465 [Gammaproteobacteria bacterium]|nr:hypothetical protein [Gammaproteobacteria bacterium]